jgi:hypothetical protein
MTTKHTPGPWFAEAVDGRWCVWDDAGIACICDVHAGVEPDPSGAEHAHLIAAAPDLLAALEVLARSFSAVAYAAWTQEMHAAVAAIAKAKGETT